MPGHRNTAEGEVALKPPPGTTSGGQKATKRVKVQYRVVQQSYEDKDYEDTPKPVLVPAALADQRFKKRRKDHPSFLFGEDMPEDFSTKRNMLMADDTRPGEEHLFEDEVEEEFGEDFIHEMMYGEVDEEDQEYFDDDEEMEEAEYPMHDTSTRAIDKQFTKMMREFDVDEEINDADADDPRTHGPLEIDQYMTALEEFVEDHAGYNMETAEPMKNKGLINQLKMMSHRNRIFDADKDGVFVTTLLPDKTSRFMAEFKRETDEIQQKARDAYAAKQRRDAERIAAGLPTEDEEEASGVAVADDTVPTQQLPSNENRGAQVKFDVVEIRHNERYDCETVLSTYSTLYNHPNVIAAARKKMNPTKAFAQERRRQHEAWEERRGGGKAPATTSGQSEEQEEEEEAEDERGDDKIDLTVRPKDESAEEKKLRRQLVKQLQREKRQQKKELKVAYRDAALSHSLTAPMSKQARTQASLSIGKQV